MNQKALFLGMVFAVLLISAIPAEAKNCPCGSNYYGGCMWQVRVGFTECVKYSQYCSNGWRVGLMHNYWGRWVNGRCYT